MIYGDISSVYFRIASNKLAKGSLQLRATTIDGEQISATAQIDGAISSVNINGNVDNEFCVVSARFNKLVKANSIFYNAVGISLLPVDSKVVNIDLVRLPPDGQVSIYRVGDTVLIGNRQKQDLGSAFTAGQTINLNRQNLTRICLKDSDDTPVNAEMWDYDLQAGTITFASNLNLSQYKMPLIAYHAIEETNRITKVDIDGTLSLMFDLKHNYPVENTYISSVNILGDLKVRVYDVFTQRSWTREWLNEPQGDPLLNTLNLTNFPMVLTGDGTITERWVIIFDSNKQVEVYGEKVGYVGRFDILQGLAPINKVTNKPFWSIPTEAFGDKGGNWSRNDVIRFNTEGTLMPVAILRAVSPSNDIDVEADSFTQCLYGDTTEV